MIEISSIESLLKSESWNYLESKERFFVKTIYDKLSQHIQLHQDEINTTNMILKKYKKFT